MSENEEARNIRRWIGRWIIGVGFVHMAVGIIEFYETLFAIASDGVWNTVDGIPGRPLAFWFMLFGLLMILFGALVDFIESRGLSIPRPLSWVFFFIVLLGILAIPVGGGWLLLPPAVGVVVKSTLQGTNGRVSIQKP